MFSTLNRIHQKETQDIMIVLTKTSCSKTTQVDWLKSNLLLKIECFEADI